MSDPTVPKVILSYGLGVDSTAILVRWLTEPASRDFDLRDLLVVTAMTGDEWPRSGALVEEHILPLLRKHRVRYAQVARASCSQTDGIKVLDDSRDPHRLYLEGAYKLSDEMFEEGTIPQTGGKRLCSVKAKGWVLDTFIEDVTQGHPYRNAIGFEADELERVAKDFVQTVGKTERTAFFPLVEWGWNRLVCEEYLEAQLGVEWPKSACVYCPFAITSKAKRAAMVERWRVEPELGLFALLMEHNALALNPRMGLAGGLRMIDEVARLAPELAAKHRERLESTPHALYDVERAWYGAITAARRLTVLDTGSKRQMEARLAAGGGDVEVGEDGILRKWIVRSTPGSKLRRRDVERFLVAAPQLARAKGNKALDTAWKDWETGAPLKPPRAKKGQAREIARLMVVAYGREEAEAKAIDLALDQKTPLSLEIVAAIRGAS
jgi:hypothetical protein